jgi:hypothetical protein
MTQNAQHECYREPVPVVTTAPPAPASATTPNAEYEITFRSSSDGEGDDPREVNVYSPDGEEKGTFYDDYSDWDEQECRPPPDEEEIPRRPARSTAPPADPAAPNSRARKMLVPSIQSIVREPIKSDRVFDAYESSEYSDWGERAFVPEEERGRRVKRQRESRHASG